ncbi:MAG: cytochrome P450 [Phenylobacterium sp.]
MNAVTAGRLEVLRPRKSGLVQAVGDLILAHLDLIFRVLRFVWPITVSLPNLGVVVTRNDDVREVLLNNGDFHVEQAERMGLLMDNTPFMLGLDDRDAFVHSRAPLEKAVRREDGALLTQWCGERAAELVAEARGRIEVVDYIRQIALDVFSRYTGVTQPTDHHDLRIMTTRFYEYQVTPEGGDSELKKEAERQAKALRDYIDGLIADAKHSGPKDDTVLGRLLIYQADHPGALSCAEIRSNLIGLLIGALPQLPIGAPQTVDQLLSRPRELAAAAESARFGDDATLQRYLLEASRFAPLAPLLMRRCVRNHEIASGAWRHTTIKKGQIVTAALLSAMKDPRRVADPEMFDPDRGEATYLHFGFGLHTCFFAQINPLLLTAMLKPLLACEGLARERGRRGRLLMRGIFTDQLWLRFTPPARTEPSPQPSSVKQLAPA